ncbi:MAG TPA: ATP-dependent DNA ligase, partial [Phycisphaerales bacterium]|nr:ATP-dependent DNA ligase [Phycisphaerales bacterium]
KWDGFRCLVFRDGAKVFLQSRSGQPLARYFPDLVAAFKALKPRRFVLDGEIVIPVAGRLSFDDLLLRIHPAASRVKLLSGQHPALYAAFDLLTDERGTNLTALPLVERRAALERFAATALAGAKALRLSPVTTSLEGANKWFDAAGGDLDGIIAKRLDMPYRSGERDAMQKVKHRRTADCIVGGYRLAAPSKGAKRPDPPARKLVGSLLLGLYNGKGELDHVGFTSSFTRAERARVTRLVTPLKAAASFNGRTPGRPSRWSTEASTKWQPVKPTLVVEVEYDHFTGGRFRHGTKLLRFRPDKPPRQCTTDQADLRPGSTLPLLIKPRKRR